MNRAIDLMHINSATVNQLYERIIGGGLKMSEEKKKAYLMGKFGKTHAVLVKTDAAFAAAIDPKTTSTLLFDIVYGDSTLNLVQDKKVVHSIEAECVRQIIYQHTARTPLYSTYLYVYPKNGEIRELESVPFYLKRGHRGAYVFMITSLSQTSVPKIPFDFQTNDMDFSLRMSSTTSSGGEAGEKWMNVINFTSSNKVKFQGQEKLFDFVMPNPKQVEDLEKTSQKSLFSIPRVVAKVAAPPPNHRDTIEEEDEEEEEEDEGEGVYYEEERVENTNNTGYDDEDEDEDVNTVMLTPPQKCNLVIFEGSQRNVIKDALLVEVTTDRAAKTLSLFVLVEKEEIRAHGDWILSKGFMPADNNNPSGNYLPYLYTGFHAHSKFENSKVMIFMEGLKVDVTKKKMGMNPKPNVLDVNGMFQVVVNY